MVMSASEDEAGFKRSLLNHIMAFPVVLKVGVLIEEPMLALGGLCKHLQNSIQEAIAIENSVNVDFLSR
ncbi:Bestrophin, RFP-TM, chloride channel [Musa troglodytarum]|uniref:Bestrophin, RFP-TM, chloride channel n=1 Tax=Musa troglodytarum TaxID=320322 RepID=A0A9E7ENM4_9LILI|nr:Bestrophin, RFP-TM, chloride channel [Musa troglodytarum]